MPTRLERLLPVFDRARRKVDNFGLRSTRILIRTRPWVSGKTEIGTSTNVVDLELDPRPRVAWSPDGNALRVDRITPSFPGGGYTPAQLNPPQAAGVEHIYVAIPPDGLEYHFRLRFLDTRKTSGYVLHLEAIDRAPSLG